MTQTSASEMGATSLCQSWLRRTVLPLPAAPGSAPHQHPHGGSPASWRASCPGEKLFSAALCFQPGLVLLGEVWWGIYALLGVQQGWLLCVACEPSPVMGKSSVEPEDGSIVIPSGSAQPADPNPLWG